MRLNHRLIGLKVSFLFLFLRLLITLHFDIDTEMNSTKDRVDLYIEALIFAAEYALSVEEIRSATNNTFGQKFSIKDIEKHLSTISAKYESDEFAIHLIPIAQGYMFMTKSRYHKIIGDYLRQNEKKRLSKSAMETLSIVAYKQPITKSGIESIRGVGCDYAVQKLLEKELVEIKGRHEGPGRPLLYGTTIKFLNHFGIKDTKELPNLKEFETVENTIGEEVES